MEIECPLIGHQFSSKAVESTTSANIESTTLTFVDILCELTAALLTLVLSGPASPALVVTLMAYSEPIGHLSHCIVVRYNIPSGCDAVCAAEQTRLIP